jgi:ABC-type multidrug transport system permease subunit
LHFSGAIYIATSLLILASAIIFFATFNQKPVSEAYRREDRTYHETAKILKIDVVD